MIPSISTPHPSQHHQRDIAALKRLLVIVQAAALI
jgi:hypothetical protein